VSPLNFHCALVARLSAQAEKTMTFFNMTTKMQQRRLPERTGGRRGRNKEL